LAVDDVHGCPSAAVEDSSMTVAYVQSDRQQTAAAVNHIDKDILSSVCSLTGLFFYDNRWLGSVPHSSEVYQMGKLLGNTMARCLSQCQSTCEDPNTSSTDVFIWQHT